MVDFCTSLKLTLSDKPKHINFNELCPLIFNLYSALFSDMLDVREPTKFIRETCLEQPFTLKMAHLFLPLF